MTIPEKIKCLEYCLVDGSHEDAAMHLCDLLEYCRKRIKPSARKPFGSLAAMVRQYGADPEAIEEEGR